MGSSLSINRARARARIEREYLASRKDKHTDRRRSQADPVMYDSAASVAAGTETLSAVGTGERVHRPCRYNIAPCLSERTELSIY